MGAVLGTQRSALTELQLLTSRRACARSCVFDRSRLMPFRGGYGCIADISRWLDSDLYLLPDRLSETRSAGHISFGCGVTEPRMPKRVSVVS